MTCVADEGSEPTTVSLSGSSTEQSSPAKITSRQSCRRTRLPGLHDTSMIVERDEFEREVTLHECAQYLDDYSFDILEQPKHTYLEHDIDEDDWKPSDELLTLNNQIGCERKVMTKLRTWLRKSDLLENARFDRTRCDTYCMNGLECTLSSGYSSQDAARPWITYWILNALSIMGDVSLGPLLRRSKLMNSVIDFLSQRCQISPDCLISCTSKGDTSYRFEIDNDIKATTTKRRRRRGGGFGGGQYQLAHLATSFGAVMSLCTLGTSESLSSINRLSLYHFICSNRQSKDGSYTIHNDGETDIRAVYCAFASAYILRLNGSLDEQLQAMKKDGSSSLSSLSGLFRPLTDPLTYQWLRSCQRYDGGFAQEPCDEAHGGYAYCGFASLLIMQQSFLDDYRNSVDNKHAAKEQISRLKDGFLDPKVLDRIHRWAAMKQMSFAGGFQGRTDKLVDACYSFWVGALFPLLQIGFAQYREYCDILSEGITTIAADISGDSDVIIESDMTMIKEEEEEEKQSTNESSIHERRSARYDGLISMEPFQLQKYLLIAAQTPPGGFCDKPYKPADYYHNCYALNGLSISQHYSAVPERRDGGSETASDPSVVVVGPKFNKVKKVHPLFGITMDKFDNAMEYYQSQPSIFTLVSDDLKSDADKADGDDDTVTSASHSAERTADEEDTAVCATV